MLNELGGAKSGLPFFAFLDASGKKLADSNALPGGKNIGCPATEEEIQAFKQLLRKTAPRLTDDARDRIASRFRELAPKQ